MQRKSSEQGHFQKLGQDYLDTDAAKTAKEAREALQDLFSRARRCLQQIQADLDLSAGLKESKDWLEQEKKEAETLIEMLEKIKTELEMRIAASEKASQSMRTFLRQYNPPKKI